MTLSLERVRALGDRHHINWGVAPQLALRAGIAAEMRQGAAGEDAACLAAMRNLYADSEYYERGHIRAERARAALLAAVAAVVLIILVAALVAAYAGAREKEGMAPLSRHSRSRAESSHPGPS